VTEETDVRRSGGGDAPAEFAWRGQTHRVRAVLRHRLERSGAEDAPPPQEVWRVRAVAVPTWIPGVFELRFDWGAGRWTVSRIDTLEDL
jgi:hypothetical protein